MGSVRIESGVWISEYGTGFGLPAALCRGLGAPWPAMTGTLTFTRDGEEPAERVAEVVDEMSHTCNVRVGGVTMTLSRSHALALFRTPLEVGARIAFRRLPDSQPAVPLGPEWWSLADRWAYRCPGCKEYSISVSQYPHGCPECHIEWGPPVAMPESEKGGE